MEVRPTNTRTAVEDLRPDVAIDVTQQRTSDDRLARIAGTLARALGVPMACVYVNEEGGRRIGYGHRDDGLDEYVATIDLDDESTGPIVAGPRDSRSGGDGAAIQSFAAVPFGGARNDAGYVCVADYRDRHFDTDELELLEQFSALAQDEVEQRSTIRTLRREEQRFRAVTENALDVVAILDPAAVFQYLSHSATGVLGISPSDGIGRSLFDGVLQDDAEVLAAGLADGSTVGDKIDIEYRYIHPDGGLRYLRLRGRNLVARTGVEGFIVHIRDATERVHFEEELRKSRDQAEEMSRLKSVFLTNMSHEIRTPLTTILGFAEILEDEVGEDEREFVRLIQQGGQRLLDTLMSILDLARLESSSFEINLEEFDIAKKVWETCLLLEPLAQEKGLQLRVETPDEPIPAVLDISAVERVVSNLVSNGIKFTSEGGVTLRMEADVEHVLIHVEDTGIGVSDEFMPFLFDEFKQESEGLSRIHEGSGLGLPITKRLVQLMKGDIMADSVKGTGSVFTVALPRNGEAPSGGDGAGTESPGKPRVLVVEDNADTRTLVNHLLRKNYEVVCASDADEALKLASESQFVALLVDINLGKGKSGEDVLHDIKALPAYEDTPCVAVTAYAMPGDRERFFSEGFDDYVSKPFSKQRLLEALEGVLDDS
ncbi:MAG: ATP-binding protein [Rhodothermales bacterium]